jgi:uncharacterized protein (DUF1919 family)
MDTFSLPERMLGKIRDAMIPLLAPFRRMKLKSTDFTIISNNCWAGICYEYYGLQKMSPTVGLYFFAEDYIKFVSNFERYINTELHFISAEDSKHKKALYEKGEQNVPIGVLDDVEIIFRHYKTPEIALEKWNRRCKRINKNNLFFKFSYMNGCTDECVRAFENLKLNNTVVLCHKNFDEYKDVVVVASHFDNEVDNDTFYWNRFFDTTAFLNGEGLKKRRR